MVDLLPTLADALNLLTTGRSAPIAFAPSPRQRRRHVAQPLSKMLVLLDLQRRCFTPEVMSRVFGSGWMVLGVLLGTVACQKPSSEAGASPAIGKEQGALQAASAEQGKAVPPAAPAALEKAEIGSKAPAFELPDLDGKTVRLSEHQGKVVVLEWFNPECPFVRASHTKGSLVNTAERLQKQGIVYLAINSGAPGKQGHGVEANRAGARAFNLQHPILLDESGAVGKAYGATNTPHLFVIDAQGTLVYGGAVDNSPDGEGESPEGGKLVSYVEQAVTAVLAGQPVPTPSTKAYGCSVKYGS